MSDDYLPDRAAATLPCYDGVPTDVVMKCERAHVVSKAVRLEALRQVRDWLAPYGAFRQWCIDHEENYGSVQYMLSQAYGNVSKRPIEETSSAAWIDAPDAATIAGLAERNRALEAEVALYRSRSAADWAAEARRQEAHERMTAWARETLAGLQQDFPDLHAAVVDGTLTLNEAVTRALLATFTPHSALRAEQPDVFEDWVAVSVYGHLRDAGSIPADATVQMLAGRAVWVTDTARGLHLTTRAEVDAWVTPARAEAFMDGMTHAAPLPERPEKED